MNRIPHAVLALQLTLQAFVQDRLEHLEEKRDRGVSAMEYGALILVAAAVIGILMTAIDGPVKTGVNNAITKLFGGGVEEPPAEE